jgi:glycosyltransferase involved in cell wall biosynthesis
MAVFNFSDFFLNHGIGVAVSALSNGPMSDVFRNVGIDINIERPNTKSIEGYNHIIVNSLIRHDATDFLATTKTPFFQYIHEDWGPDDFIGGLNQQWGWHLPKWSDFYKSLACAKGVIFPAEYLMKKFPDELRKTAIFNPINRQSLGNIRKVSTLDIGFDVINIGTINPRKNQELLVKICANNRDEISSCRLFGERRIRSSEIKYIDSLVKNSKTDEKLNISINKTQFPLSFEFYNSSVFIMTSLAEVLPCTIQEMMYVGIPVIAPNDFGIPEIIENNLNGFLYNYENSEKEIIQILKKLKNKEIKSRIVNSAKNYSEKNFNSIINGEILFNFLTEKYN